jgi:hypothetical protein
VPYKELLLEAMELTAIELTEGKGLGIIGDLAGQS